MRMSSLSQDQRPAAAYSVVRQVGDRLPINTGKRLYIQLPSQSVPSTPGLEVRYAATGERLTQDEDGLRSLSYLKDHPSSEGEGLYSDEESMLIDEEVEPGTEDGSQMTMDKISALESELAKLKAQIAVYALAETKDLPVPPPPPLPPTMPPVSSHQQGGAAPVTIDDRMPATPARPPMVSMLKDLGSVKLRTVDTARSPGGTPLRRHNTDTQEPLESDPASIIATALRKKFANRVFQDSPDKENLNQSEMSLSEFDSPNVKLQFN